MTNKGFLFVNIMTVGHSWGFVDGNSWMAIREFVGLRGWQFVGLRWRQLFGKTAIRGILFS